MATKIETEYPSSLANDESDPDDLDNSQDDEEDTKPINSNVANILARLQSSGALIKKPKQEYHCFQCNIDFYDLNERDKHLIKHVTLPDVVLEKLHLDEEDTPSGDDNWSDEEMATPNQAPAKAPQKIDISQILKRTGISLKKPGDNQPSSSTSALSKLSGLGFTIKKSSLPIKTEKPDTDSEKNQDVMQRLEKLGGIKLKLKSDGSNTNTFKVVNGLKDFKTSDDEEEASENDESKEDIQEFDIDRSGEQDVSGGEEDSGDEQFNNISRKTSESDDSDKGNRNIRNLSNEVQLKAVTADKETPVQVKTSNLQEEIPLRSGNRPVIKQTPKRGALPIASKELPVGNGTMTERKSMSSTPERRESIDVPSNVTIKQEAQETNVEETTQSNSSIPLFPEHSGGIKSERVSPTLSNSMSTPIIAKVKSDPEGSQVTSNVDFSAHSYQTSSNNNVQTPLTPITKIEPEVSVVIEINGDSNDEDDDCCVVSATPAPDVKPKIESLPVPPPCTTTSSSYSAAQTNYTTTPTLQSRLTSAPSTEKQHNFNWNAPESKPAIDILEKSADEMFESLLSSANKKENMSLSDANEYISLDTLGPQHSCEMCNTRFTDISLLEEHKRTTGHSTGLVAPASATLVPYNSSTNILSNLLPVKHLAEQVGKLSTIGNSGAGFTHQQNVMINIQAYPGGSGVMVPPPSYNAYPQTQNMHGGFPQQNMYGAPAQQMPGQQIPGQFQGGGNYMGQGYGQFQAPMSKPYPGGMPPPNSYANTSPYSSASPLQSMQQAVYGQSPMMNQQPLPMGPPGSSPSQLYAPSNASSMKPPTNAGIRIQNVQTFPPGQLMGPGQTTPGQTDIGPPNPAQDMNSNQMASVTGQAIGQMGGPTIRMAASANITRPRMAGVRGQRPTIRSGIQVQGQVRGGKIGPRMPMKRPGGPGGPVPKRRPDMLLPGKHDNEDCQVMAMQKQREGLPMIQSVQGAKDKLNLGSHISIKKTVNKEANAMANVLASRGISIKQKQKSRSPTPERPIPHIPNLGSGVSIKHTSKSSNFSIPEAKVGGGMLSCKICKRMFMNHNSLQVHMSNAHAQSKVPLFKCDECPASYPKSLQLQHHKRVFHNVTGPNRELGLPVVDLSQEENLKRLSNLGIYSYIPLANRESANGNFGIPVISVQNMQNGLTTNLDALGADGLLSLGPLKPLRNA